MDGGPVEIPAKIAFGVAAASGRARASGCEPSVCDIIFDGVSSFVDATAIRLLFRGVARRDELPSTGSATGVVVES